MANMSLQQQHGGFMPTPIPIMMQQPGGFPPQQFPPQFQPPAQ
jgi:hypothetical protein